MSLRDKVLQVLRQRRTIKKGSTVLIGVSGGVDSIVLSHILVALRHDLGVNLAIAHFNHRLRKTSGRDEKLVLEHAKQLNVPCFIGRNADRVQSKKVSEDQARAWRFKFFLRVMPKSRADILMLGHNQNDLAETVLMRIVRGSGLHGIRGILKERNINGIDVVRPLLDFSRKEIEMYALRNKLRFMQDETNDKEIYFRNKVRHKLLPGLEREYNPSIISSLAKLSECVVDDYDLLVKTAADRLKKNIVRSVGKIRINKVFFLKNHRSLIRLGLRSVFKELTGGLEGIGFADVNDAYELWLSGNIGDRVRWPKGISVIKSLSYLEFSL